MHWIRKVVIIFAFFIVLHGVIKFMRGESFFGEMQNTLFVFVYIGFFPIILSFAGSSLMRLRFAVLKEKAIVDDLVFSLIFAVFSVLAFYMYLVLGMLDA